jgi:sulfur-oxidizing protein SoxX
LELIFLPGDPANSFPVKAAVLAGAALLCLTAQTALADTASQDRIGLGKQLAMSRSKGNCIACHVIDGGALPGNVGPPLMSMRLRFPERAQLSGQIWDPTARNPDTMMPPFGKHLILTREEIEAIVDYLYTL